MEDKRKRQTNEEDQSRDSKHPRFDLSMDIDDATTDAGSRQSLSPSPSLSCHSPSYSTTQESSELNKMVVDMNIDLEVANKALKITEQASTVANAGVTNTDNYFSTFELFITTILKIRNEIISLYNEAEHHKELCGFLLKRCNFATAAVQDLDIRRTENEAFLSKQENLTLFKGFINCMEKIRTFIAEVSQLAMLKKYLHVNSVDAANGVEENFTRLTNEFEVYMTKLFPSTTQSKEELEIIKKEIKKTEEILRSYGVSEDEQSQQDFFNGMNLVTEKNKKFQRQNKQNKLLDSSEFKTLEENEPLLDGNHYRKTTLCPSKRIEKRTHTISFDEYCFKEFSNSPSSFSRQSNSEETQIEIRRQVNILKDLKNSDHIIRFYGVSHEDSKYYLVTEWMEHGNLFEYYTKFRDCITWKTKIKFALDICRGVAYLHECRILHRDIQSANVLVNGDQKVRIANFGLSRKFSDITRNISHSLENIRYMAPEKLNHDTGKKRAYDFRCEVYSVGALLWEIAELKKPHDDLGKSEAIIKIRKRVEEKYSLPFSDDVPCEWKSTISKAMDYSAAQRLNISDICHDFYNLSEQYSENGVIGDSKKSSVFIAVEDMEKKAKQWIEHNVQQKIIKSIPWSEFNESTKIGSGSFGTVFKAYWQNSHSYVAYKKLTVLSDIQCKTWEAFKHELRMQIRVHSCENIIRILGISKNLSDEYSIVMEYADGGNLNNYLLNNFEELDWKRKFQLALDITNGLYYLHNEKILHRDLHAGNIVIHQGKAKITDFGCSKSMNTTTNLHDNLFGNIPYAAPEIIKADNEAKQDLYTKSSDVYSLGVVLWQISSGKTPFKGQNKNMLIVTVMLGSKEKRVSGTPDEYYNLYNQCWNDEPKERPTVENVYRGLEKLLKNDKIDGFKCNSEEGHNEDVTTDLIIKDWNNSFR